MILFARTIISEYEQRQQALKAYRKAERYRHKGKLEAAQEVYEEVRDLFPDTVYAQAAARHLRELHSKVAMRAHEAGEEQDEPPCCRKGGDHSCCAVDCASQKQVAKLVDKYQQACAEGRLADAQKLAREALAIDPACFSKHAKTKVDGQPSRVPPERVHGGID